MNESMRKILQLFQEGKITAEEAEKLLLEIRRQEEAPKKAKWFRVRVYGDDMSKPKVSVNVPLGLAKAILKITGKFSKVIPENARMRLESKGISLDENISVEQLNAVIESLTEQGPLTLVEVEEEKDGKKERVEVYIE